MFRLPKATQLGKQQWNNRQFAQNERNFERKSRLVYRSYSAKEKLRARWIGARHFRVIKMAGFVRV